MTLARYPSLIDKVVLITGGGSGIGAAMVEAFADQKANVAFVDIAVEPSKELVSKIGAAHPPPLFLHCDLTDIAALETAMEEIRQRLGPISVLVNNAANDQRQAADEVSEEDWDRTMALNLKHQFFAAQIARRSMRELGGGAIVNFSSTAWMRRDREAIGLFHRQGRGHRPDEQSRARIRTRQHPCQRHRAGRGDHRAAAPPLDERERHRRVSSATMSRPNLARRRCGAHGSLSILRRQRDDY